MSKKKQKKQSEKTKAESNKKTNISKEIIEEVDAAKINESSSDEHFFVLDENEDNNQIEEKVEDEILNKDDEKDLTESTASQEETKQPEIKSEDIKQETEETTLPNNEETNDLNKEEGILFELEEEEPAKKEIPSVLNTTETENHEKENKFKQWISNKKNINILVYATIALLSILLILFSQQTFNENKDYTGKDYPDNATTTGKLIISEILSNNSNIWVNCNNQETDYIELYNGSDVAIDLSGYGLSDRLDKIKWEFPKGTTIQSGEYLVISLSGQQEEGLIASFKLSSSGSVTVVLTDRNGTIVDYVETISVDKNIVMYRNGNTFLTSKYISPGYENSQQGHEDYLASLKSTETSCLVVNELLVNNKGNFTNEYGYQDGFIELKNISEEIINLSEYCLSDSAERLYRYRFEDIQLAPGEIYYLYLGDNCDNEKYLGFEFNNKNGSVVITHNGKIVQQLEYENLANGKAYTLVSGNYYQYSTLSLGYENNALGVENFMKEHQKNPVGLMISEIMNENNSYLVQNGNQYYDWIELYNNSSQSIDLSQYCLSTSYDNLQSYRLPEVTLKPYQYYIIIASGDSNLTNNSYVHATFKLPESTSLYLSKDNKIVDSLYVCNIPNGYSYGRGNSYGFYYIETPTPKTKNNSGSSMVSATVEMDYTGGVYQEESIEVTLTSSGTIYYSLDGSTPTKKSNIYSGPIVLTKTTVLKAMNLEENACSSIVSTNTYLLNTNHTLAIVSVSLNPSDFNTLNKYYNNEDLEYGGYMELYEKEGSCAGFCSVQVAGDFGRYFDKKSYYLKFASEYGQNNLNYQVFKNRDCSSYDGLLLRSGSTDANSDEATFIKDLLATSLVDEYTDVDVQAYKLCVVYINGSYWGIYSLREKINEKFIQNHYNIPTTGMNLIRTGGKVSIGSYASYYSLRMKAASYDLSISSQYNKFIQEIDVVNFIDMWIAETYTGNYDMKNTRFFNSPYLEDGKWHTILFDLDHGFTNYLLYENYYTEHLTNPEGIGKYKKENDVIRNLFDSQEFRQLWLERLAYHLNNTFSKENLNNRIDELVEAISEELKNDRARWSQGVTYEQWQENIVKLKRFVSKRQDILLTQTKNFFGLTETEMKTIFGDLY